MNSVVYGGMGRRIAPMLTPISKKLLYRRFYDKAQFVLRQNWNAGRININDVKSYIRVIKEGNSPARFTIAEPPMLKAIEDFKNHVIRRGIVSAKPLGTLNGLEGMDGFLSSIWKGVKSVATGVIKGVTGIDLGPKEQVYGPPDPRQVSIPAPIQIKLPEGLINASMPPDSAAAGIKAAMSSPIMWVALAGLGITVFSIAMRK